MLTAAAVRKLALALPEAEESPHHGIASFRVRGKIFATLFTPGQLNVFVELGEVDAIAALARDACEPLWWGKSVRGVKVNLMKAPKSLVARLLADAWRNKAPPSLLKSAQARPKVPTEPQSSPARARARSGRRRPPPPASRAR